MANDNPQAIKFVRESVRPMADILHSLVLAAEEMFDQYTNEDIVSLIPNTSDLISDGAPADGRTPITNQDARIIVDLAKAFANDYRSNNNLKYNQTDKVSVRTRKLINL